MVSKNPTFSISARRVVLPETVTFMHESVTVDSVFCLAANPRKRCEHNNYNGARDPISNPGAV